MKRLPPDKRNKLIFVVIGSLGLISLVYFLLIGPQNEQNRLLAAQTNKQLINLEQMKRTINEADATASKVAEIDAVLDSAEADTASGDVLAWTYDTMRQFNVNRHVDITTMGQPVESDEDLFDDFPYKQIKFEIIGTGYYHDIGKYIADLENKFPHIRVLNINIDPNGSEAAPEKLSFRLEIAALVKQNT